MAACVLVIEDEKSIREEIADILGFEGFNVLEAKDGRIGVQLAREHLPDLIISDITMPEADGYEVLLELRKYPETTLIPFVFLTAHADRAFMRHGMELGADDYLTKPFTRAELLAAIRVRLSRHSALMEAHQQQLDQAKTTLTHLVTHELRTPLISIMMIQDIIGRRLGQLSEAQLRDLLDTLATGTKRLVHVVEQMVYITELESGTLSNGAVADRGKAVELWQIITTSIDLGRRFAYRNQDGTILTQQRDRDMMVVAHISALKHAMAELISNALAFSPESSTVTIAQWKADGSAWISIVDQGSGMSSEQVSQVFNEFYQVDRAKREQQGIGLGLSVAKRIIEAHGGSLSLSSVSDKGTQVVVSLPTV